MHIEIYGINYKVNMNIFVPGLSAAAERRRRRVILSRRTPPVHPRRTSAYGVYFVISK